jgi:hypothetical protein
LAAVEQEDVYTLFLAPDDVAVARTHLEKARDEECAQSDFAEEDLEQLQSR